MIRILFATLSMLLVSIIGKSQTDSNAVLSILQAGDSIKYREGYCGNGIEKFVKLESRRTDDNYIDYVDDLVNYTRVDEKIYVDRSGKPFVLCEARYVH